MHTLTGLSEHQGPSSNSPNQALREISLKKFQELLLPELQEKLVPREELVKDILELRLPEGRSQEAGKQKVRFQLLAQHLPRMSKEEKHALFHQSVEKNHSSLFQFLLQKKAPKPDTVELLCTAAKSGNEAAFQAFLEKLDNPMPADKLEQTLKRVADCGVPDKLEQVLVRQQAHQHISSDQLKTLRYRAQMQQPAVRALFGDLNAGGSVFQAVTARHAQIMSNLLNL